MVLPLRWRGQTRGVAFVKGGDNVLRSDAVFLRGFVPMIGQDVERVAALHENPLVQIHYDVDQDIDPDHLTGVFATPGSPPGRARPSGRRTRSTGSGCAPLPPTRPSAGSTPAVARSRPICASR
jgi:hypothetical protein